MRLAVKLYQPKWTDAIHAEWIRNVLEDRPDLTPAQLARTRELMNRHGGACLVTGYEALIPTLTLPDPDDRHVLAAATHHGRHTQGRAHYGNSPICAHRRRAVIWRGRFICNRATVARPAEVVPTISALSAST